VVDVGSPVKRKANVALVQFWNVRVAEPTASVEGAGADALNAPPVVRYSCIGIDLMLGT